MMKKRFKFIHQLDSKNCGLACLCMVANYHGKNLSIADLSDLCYRNKSGISMMNLKDTAERLGFIAKGVKVKEQKLFELESPYIAYWNQRHYVVVLKVSKKNVVVADPSKGILTYSLRSFLDCWTEGVDEGILLLLSPTDKFYSFTFSHKHKIELAKLFHYLLPYKNDLLKVLVCLLCGAGISVVLPLFSQVIVDNGIPSKEIGFVTLILLSQIIITIGKSINLFIQNRLLLHVSTGLSLTLISDFLKKLLNLKMSFFDSRLVGDLIQRVNDFNRIENFLCSSLIASISIVVTFLIYGGLIIEYGCSLLLIYIVSSIFYVIWIQVFRNIRSKIDYMRFQESAINYSNIVQLITGVQDIKLNTCEDKKRKEWESIQTKLYDINTKSLWINQVQEIGASLIDNVKNLLISFMTIKYVISGNMTIGMFVAIQYILGQLNIPLYQLVGLIQKMQETKLSLERINEIYCRDEECVNVSLLSDISQSDIFLDDLVFQYSGPHSPKVINHVSVRIPYGKTTAIVGSSGSGKTTLLKLLLGYYAPVSGAIYLDECKLDDVSIHEWRKQCAIVMQEGYLFSDSIAENIALSGEVKDMQRVKKAAKIACINEFIEKLPQQYDTKIGMEGLNLSNGQKQRILIARAIYKNANYIFLDEATNSLDAINEKSLVCNLNYYFKNKTMVVIAHRLSTVKNADNIIVMNNGTVIESGTHAELVSMQGEYFSLIRNQLEIV